MIQRIFSSGKGWYISGTNRYDQNDKAYMNVFFPRNEEPAFIHAPNENYTYIDIEILSHKFESYKGKINLKVFEYKVVKTKQDVDQEKASSQIPEQHEDSYDDEPWNA